MLKFTLLFAWFITALLSHAQKPNETPADVAIETKMLNDGYSLRLIGAAAKTRGEKIDAYKLILHHPDGSEDLVWNPPATEPNTNSSFSPNATIDVTLFRPQSGIVKDGVLGLVIGKETWVTDTWWLRWDLNKKRMITVVRFFAQHGGGYDFIDENTIETNNGKVTIDDQGQVLRNGRRYPRSHFVYEGQRETTYWPIDQGGKIVVTENAQVWPFLARPAVRKELPPSPPASTNGDAPPPKDQSTVAATPTTSPLPALPAAQATAEPKASSWLWLAGIAAVIVIALLVWMRRTQPQ